MSVLMLALAAVLAWLLIALALAAALCRAIDARDAAWESARDTLASPADATWERLTPR